MNIILSNVNDSTLYELNMIADARVYKKNQLPTIHICWMPRLGPLVMEE